MNLYADIYRKSRYVIPVMISKIAIPMRIYTKRLSTFCFGAGPGERAGARPGAGERPGLREGELLLDAMELCNMFNMLRAGDGEIVLDSVVLCNRLWAGE